MISLNWVKDYIDIDDENLNDLAIKITKAGINVESVITNHIDNLVIGEVVECTMHPDSDHLHICQVDIKDEILQIVCGAPNVKEKIKVIVAKPGAILPGNFEIKKGKIRGVESNGMICALFELGLEEKNDETYSKGIEILSEDAPIGKNPIDYLELDDTLYELDVHKHRNNDCYYHIGFAYEIGTILNKEVKLPNDNYNEDKDNIKNYFSLTVDTDKCPYYLAKMVKNVTIKESPEFIKKRLASVGMRSINNVVDISNYVMLEYGQPMHFFDKDSLGNEIVVRNAKEDESIITLDGKERILNSKDIVITDGRKPVCIAGIMGGENTEVTENTKNILIESAIFDAINIRNTASKLNLKSEASIRYGKGLNYEYTKKAIDRACHLLEKYADATILSGTIIHDNIEKNEKIVEFKGEEINKMLGITIKDSDIEIELKRLGFNYKLEDKKFIVTIPNRRLDIDPNINDIAEEIGRLYGYHNLISTLPKGEYKRGEYIGDVKYRKLVSKRLRALGLNETKNYTLVSPQMASLYNYENRKQIALPNPMSVDKSIIRTSLISSLLNVYDYNKARKVNDIMIYEISKTYDENYEEDIKVSILMKGNYLVNDWQHKFIKIDFYLLKGIIENVFEFLGLRNRYDFEKSEIVNIHPGVCANILLDRKPIGIIGRVHPNINKDEIYVAEFSLSKLITSVKPIKYKEFSKYPSISKDVAFIVNKNILAVDIMNEIRRVGGRLLTSINIFDVYIGENINKGEKSIAFNLIFSDANKTLNEEEAMNIFNRIIESVKNKFDAKLRNK